MSKKPVYIGSPFDTDFPDDSPEFFKKCLCYSLKT